MKAGFVCVLLLFLSFMFTATASRSSVWMKNEVSLQEIHFQDKTDAANYEKNMEFDESTRRIDLENTDYGGTGANGSHDPLSPGRA